jgi:hypothetical protein
MACRSGVARPAEVLDIEEWGATAESEAQWRHPFEASEISLDHTYPN